MSHTTSYSPMTSGFQSQKWFPDCPYLFLEWSTSPASLSCYAPDHFIAWRVFLLSCLLCIIFSDCPYSLYNWNSLPLRNTLSRTSWDKSTKYFWHQRSSRISSLNQTSVICPIWSLPLLLAESRPMISLLHFCCVLWDILLTLYIFSD